ncbi:OmpA family protein [Saccharothrix isguenensis]
MRLPMKTFLVAVKAVVVAAVLAACTGDVACACAAADQGSVAYVLGAHANRPAVASPDILDDAVERQTTLSVIRADGKPEVVITADLVSKAPGPNARNKEVRDRKADLRAKLSSVRPTTAELDLLAAIELGARSLAREPKTMVVESSGLSTTGALSFAKPGMLMAAPAEVADALERGGHLPALGGIRVTLRGLGDVMPPQQVLGTPERSNLIAIWKEVLTRAGAQVEPPDQRPLTGPTWTDAPPVATVPVTPASVDFGAPEPRVTRPLPAAAFFVADSAELLDRANAVAVLRPFAEHVRRSGGRLDLVGTTARVGDRPGQVALSTDRANAMRSLLVDELGVPEDRVGASGVGSYHADYVVDHDDHGHLLPDKAGLNRTVRVTVHD